MKLYAVHSSRLRKAGFTNVFAGFGYFLKSRFAVEYWNGIERSVCVLARVEYVRP